MKMFSRTTLCLSIFLFLTACGGGGGGSTAEAPIVPVSPVVPIVPAVPVGTVASNLELSVICSGANCAAQNSSTYSGSGIGLWAYENTGTQEELLPININGVTGKTATIIYTNLGTTPQPLNIPSTLNRNSDVLPINPLKIETNEEKIQQFNMQGYKAILKTAQPNARTFQSTANVVNDAVVGSTKVWTYYQSEGSVMEATFLLAQQVAAYDGKKINFWVDVNEYNPSKVTDSDLIDLASKFAKGDDSLYKNITDIAGQSFGPNSFSNLIASSNQSINVVIANLNPDKHPYGQLGYFASENNFQKSSIPVSNEALSVFLDSETLYILVPGNAKDVAKTVITSALTHEFTHLVNFYQRHILKNADFPSRWLEESSAMGMEDILSNKINPNYSSQKDNRYIAYLSSAQYNCPMNEFNVGCDDYQRTGTFITFLNRKYGLPFYRGLLKNFSSQSAVEILDNQIKASGGIGYQDELKKFSTNFAVFPASNVPTGFGFPALVSEGFTLPAMYRDDYASYRVLPSKPAQLNGGGSMYYYEVKNLPSSFTQNIAVPAKTNVSIVIK